MKKKRKSRATTIPIGTLIKEGQAHLAAGRYRDGMETYKQLLKREQRPEWREALGRAYLGRAQELAGKGMYKEAVALWENMSNICGTPRHVDLYVSWLLKAGRVVRGARMFAEADESFRQSSLGQHLAALLGGLLLSGQTDEITEALPADSPLIQQQDIVVAAARAYCAGDDEALNTHLKRIPYRSPYRDLRVILQALSLLDTNPQEASSLLDKIAVDSPVTRLVELVRKACLDGEHLLEALAGADSIARAFVLTLKGWDATKIKATEELQTLGDKQTAAKALLKFISGNTELFDALQVQGFCLSLLPDYPAGIADYEKQFGALAPAERERLLALAAERRDNSEQAIQHWRICVNHLTRHKPKGEEAIKTALILRHLAEFTTAMHGPDPWDRDVLTYLSRSLELDPEDKKTYLVLMEMAQQRDDQKNRDRWVERAVKQFPEDADILMAATMAAYHRGAFKKAAGFAQTLLQRDSINQSARNMLLSSHLAHARKQTSAGKYALAAKELDIVKRFTRDDEQSGVVELNEGFLALLTGSKEAGMSLLQQAYRHLGGGVVAQFRFLVDGQRMGFDQRTLAKHYAQIKDNEQPPIVQKDVLRLVDFIHRYLSDGFQELFEVLDQLYGPLKAAASLDFGEKEMQAICAAFQRAEHHLLLRDYAEAALKRWEHRPVFVYYSVFGRTKGWNDKLTSNENIELENALDQALDEEDHETARQIEEFLGFPAFGPGPMPFGPPFGPPGLGGALEDLMEDLVDEFGVDDVDDALDMLAEKLRKAGLPVPKHPRGRGR